VSENRSCPSVSATSPIRGAIGDDVAIDVVDDDVDDVVASAAERVNTACPTITRVATFPAAQLRVTGHRNTPVDPSAHNRTDPAGMISCCKPHPATGRTDTMRVRSVGLSDELLQHNCGAGLLADHVVVVPTHVSPLPRRDTSP